jgi:hypothetical protein
MFNAQAFADEELNSKVDWLQVYEEMALLLRTDHLGCTFAEKLWADAYLEGEDLGCMVSYQNFTFDKSKSPEDLLHWWLAYGTLAVDAGFDHIYINHEQLPLQIVHYAHSLEVLNESNFDPGQFDLLQSGLDIQWYDYTGGATKYEAYLPETYTVKAPVTILDGRLAYLIFENPRPIGQEFTDAGKREQTWWNATPAQRALCWYHEDYWLKRLSEQKRYYEELMK